MLEMAVGDVVCIHNQGQIFVIKFSVLIHDVSSRASRGVVLEWSTTEG